MKTKICIIITALIFFTASELAAVEDKIFTSSGQILPGEEWGNVYIYNDDTIVDMLGGLVDSTGTYDASTLNVTGGTVYTLEAHEFSIANISGGYVYGLHALDYAVVNFLDNASAVTIGSGDFGTLNMMGGTADNVGAGDSGTLNLYGGIIEDSLGASREAVINIYGYGFNYDPTAGRFDGGQLTGFWLDDTPFSIDLYGAETYSHINLIPVVYAEVDIKPTILNLASKGKWVTCRIWLPDDCNVANINPDTILLERRIKPAWAWFNEQQQVAMVKFSRSELVGILEPGEVELTVSGELVDGTVFEGTDIIRVIDKRHLRRGLVNSNSIVKDGIEYYIQTDKSVYTLGDDIEILYRITNLTDEEWRLVGFFPIMDIIVEAREGKNFNEIWHWSWDKIHPMGPIVFRLEPGESAELNGIWPQIDLHGSVEPEDHTQVPPGRYRISGVFYPTDSSIAVDITIVKRKS